MSALSRDRRKRLFELGIDRYAWHGRDAYQMKYPHCDSESVAVAALAAQAYLAGVKSKERGLSYSTELREVLK